MFSSVSGTEILAILALALLIFGPRRLPQIGRTIGKALADFRGAANEFRSSVEAEVEMEKLRETRDSVQGAGREITKSLRDAATAPVPRSRSRSDEEPRHGDREDDGTSVEP